MLDILQKNLQLIEKINLLSANPALSLADITYVHDELNSFEISLNEYLKFIKHLKDINACDIEYVNEIIKKNWQMLQDFEEIIIHLQDTTRLLWKNYVFPCPDIDLQNRLKLSNTPILLAKLEERLKPLEYLKIKQEFFNFQGTYFFIKLANVFLINAKYESVKILCDDLSLLKDIKFLPQDFENINFDYWYTFTKFNSDEVILINTYHDTPNILYIDAYKGIYKIISPGPLGSVLPRKSYWWQDDELIMYSEGAFYGINPYTETKRIIGSSEVERDFLDFYRFAVESCEINPSAYLRAYPQKFIFIYRDVENLRLIVKNTKQCIRQIINYYNEEVFDVKIFNEYTMFIEESRIDVRKGNNRRVLILPDPGCFFNGAEFLEKNGKCYIYAMQGTNHIGLGASITIYEISDSFRWSPENDSVLTVNK